MIGSVFYDFTLCILSLTFSKINGGRQETMVGKMMQTKRSIDRSFDRLLLFKAFDIREAPMFYFSFFFLAIITCRDAFNSTSILMTNYCL